MLNKISRVVQISVSCLIPPDSGAGLRSQIQHMGGLLGSLEMCVYIVDELV